MVTTSVISRGSETLDAFTRRSQPKIDIHLDGQKPGLVSSYTTGDQIDGTVTITVDHDIRFDEIEIVLQGMIIAPRQLGLCAPVPDLDIGISRTTVERAACPGRTGSEHMFLKLRQPIEETDYPTPRMFEAGHKYTFAFQFVIPDQLLPQVCTHMRKNDAVHRSHTMLPPTLGDPMLAGNGKSLLDDMAPEMSQISYIIRAGVFRRSSTDQRQVKTLANFAKKVRIIPIVEEEPPIDVGDHHQYYCTRKEKSVRRGFLRGKLGRMIATTVQPKPIRLLPLSCEAPDTVSTVATVQLRFDPVGNEMPPKLGSMTSKLKASTFYSAGPWEDYPCQSGSMPFSQVGQGLFNESVPLSTMCVASAQWQKHSTSDCERRGSTQTTSTCSEDSTSVGTSPEFTGETYYTASVVIPVNLPASKTFVPTFHSCLMSRTYSLDLSLSYHTPGTNVLTPTVTLRVPVQIITQTKYASSVKSELGLVVTQAELDEYFSPRSVTASINEPVVNVNLAPPEYSEATARSIVRA
ncbi:hypothetical protein N7532_012034 [Penicillium argentinense]|uniref:Bul1 C-terminal domain-containing protein n=1 Tax=Penicillium argentinense TaxID=1131581 RepID=A0A9W9EJT4_9EURO|nr:uncharacterized protein N7532_012034 [Penicillium argentinense]KAJ5082991.1 hypothetical protein N7532_012034 [Penicillium argentinense]